MNGLRIDNSIKLFLCFCLVLYLYLYFLETQNDRYHINGAVVIDKQSRRAFSIKEWYEEPK
jgi:hypothetical protein